MVGHHKNNASRCMLRNLNNTDGNNHLANDYKDFFIGTQKMKLLIYHHYSTHC